jgi:peptide/nickel transport system substrate-binding protein
MSLKDVTQYEIDRRNFLRLSGIAGAGAVMVACGAPAGGGDEAAAPAAEGGEAAAPAGEGAMADVPREKTMILMFGGDGTQFVDTGLGNPYATGATHQIGSAALWEPLYFYSAFADEEIPWLATGYEYTDDFTELTISIREGVEWSDGEPFTAGDVAFTINMLIENAPVLPQSQAVAAAVASAEAVDDLTVVLTMNGPQPRFMFNRLMSKFDTGLYMVPEHVFADVDEVAAFEYFDPEQGWPLATGPYKISEWTPSQKFIDRRDDWWGVKTGFAEALPAIERIIMIPRSDDTLMTQRIVNNEVDSILDLRANVIGQTVAQNPAIITHTGTDLPLGYMDWWPSSIWFNHEEGPFANKDVRWAVSYSIDRQQLLDVGLQGSGILTELPFPQYPVMQKYFDAAADLLAQYPTNEFNLDKAAELMEGQGYEKDDEGFWVKDGERITQPMGGWAVFNDIGPLIAEQLRRGGFEIDYVTPADHGTRMSDGTAKIWINGHGGTIADPFTTMDYYTSKYWAPIGEPTAQNSRFNNAEYDELLAQMASTPSDDPAYMDLYLAALEIWLDNLVDAPIQQWLHRIPMNTTYWTNWPTEDNPYVNGAFWHQTFPLMLHEMEPAQ